jgi:drug/metabolite transporter (DMT)-like permease
MMLVLAVLWGGSFYFYKVLVAALPPLTVVLGRVGISALLLNGWLCARGRPLWRHGARWRDFVVLSLLNNVVPFSLIAAGEIHVTSGMAAILNATTPMFTLIVAHGMIHDEPLTRPRLAGVVAGLLAVIVLVGPSALTGQSSAYLVSELACLGAALSYAFAAAFARRFRDLDPVDVATGQVTAATIVLIPLVALFDRPWQLALPDPGIWAALAGLAILSTVFAYVFYFAIIARAGAGNAALVTLLLPFAALMLGVMLLHEAVPLRFLAALALIGFGFTLIDGRLLTRIIRAVGRA